MKNEVKHVPAKQILMAFDDNVVTFVHEEQAPLSLFCFFAFVFIPRFTNSLYTPTT